MVVFATVGAVMGRFDLVACPVFWSSARYARNCALRICRVVTLQESGVQDREVSEYVFKEAVVVRIGYIVLRVVCARPRAGQWVGKTMGEWSRKSLMLCVVGANGCLGAYCKIQGNVERLTERRLKKRRKVKI